MVLPIKITVLKETTPFETRVAITPELVKKYITGGFSVYIEKGAGEKAGFSDQEYNDAGAKISSIPLELLADADIVLKVQPSSDDLKEEGVNEMSFMREKAIIIGLLSPYNNKNLFNQYAYKKITSFAMELIPRTTRAQSMDVLSSQSNLAGYKAVLEAANIFGRGFPMLVTAAGTVAPAKVLVLGAGVAGLQAIATAKRLGAIVSAFDVRSAAKEQVESLGANFIYPPEQQKSDMETAGGYAKEASEEQKRIQQAFLHEAIQKADIVISTALIPGRKAPLLITKQTVLAMKPGSVIVDLASAGGGNCEMTKPDKVILFNNVTIMGYTNLPARIATDASRLYARNVFNFVNLLHNPNSGVLEVNIADDIIKATLVTHYGEIVNDLVKGVQ